MSNILERGRRIELLTLAWKAKVMPFYEPRIDKFVSSSTSLIATILPVFSVKPRTG